MKIYSRADWGARYANGFGNRAVGRLNKFLHHSVTSNLPENATFAQDAAQVRTLENIGQQRFRGGISYTFAIAPSGRIFEGHSIGRIGAHTKGYNTVGVGIVLIGTYSSRTPTKAQQDALVWLLQEGVRRGWWKDPALTGGHRNVVSTSCPGDAAYAIIPTINARGRGQSVSPAPAPKPSPAPAPKPAPKKNSHAKRNYAKGEVTNIQRTLKALGYYKGLVDDDYGSMTADAVGAYQRAQLYWPGKVVDNDWGPATQKHYEWTKVLQATMNKWKGTKIAVDGDYGHVTRNRVIDLMRRNLTGAYLAAGRHFGYTAVKVDGIPGKVFCKMLAIATHP